MVMETLLASSQNTLKFFVKSRHQAFLYPGAVRSQLTEHVILQGSINIPGQTTHALKGEDYPHFLVNSERNHLGTANLGCQGSLT